MEQETNNKSEIRKRIVIAIILIILLLLLIFIAIMIGGRKKSGSKDDGNSSVSTTVSVSENNTSGDDNVDEESEPVIVISVVDFSVMESKSDLIEVVVTADGTRLSEDEVTITYRIEDESIATVDADGNIAGLKPGKTILHVTVTTADGKSETKDVEIEITEDDSARATVSIGNDKLAKGDKTKISVKYRDDETANGGIAPTVTYSSDNSKVVTVDKSGNVKAAGVGTAEITVQIAYTTSNGEVVEETYTVAVEVHKHDYVKAETKAATCAEEGVNTFTCKICEDTYTENTAKLKHKYDSVETKAATCTATGEMKHTCELCGDSYVEATSKKKHDYAVTASTPATCTQNGTETHTCKVCGDTYTGAGATATGHSYSVTSHTDSTCQVAGNNVYTCTCGDTYTDTLALAAHTLGGWTTDAVVAGTRTTNYKWDDFFKICSVCHAQVDRHAHSILNQGDICGTCGTQMPVY